MVLSLDKGDEVCVIKVAKKKPMAYPDRSSKVQVQSEPEDSESEDDNLLSSLKFLRQRAPVAVSNVSAPLLVNLQNKWQKKIWRGEFIDFYELLRQSKSSMLHAEPMDFVTHEGRFFPKQSSDYVTVFVSVSFTGCEDFIGWFLKQILVTF